MSEEKVRRMLKWDDFPRSSKYDPIRVANHSMGPNVLWLTEALCEVMKLAPGMRVLDLGCGAALSSIFLAKEFGLQVWATDLWVNPSDNLQRIREAGVEETVFPIYADARALPFASDFFDAVVSLDSYHYFGTDVEYLDGYLLRLVKKECQIGIVSPAVVKEMPHPLPKNLTEDWVYRANCVEWWSKHWNRCPQLDVELAEALPNGWELWNRWDEALSMDEPGPELEMLRSEVGRCLGFVRMVGHRSGA
ncbi:MAG TPA: methyltransferase domain-containing protein [Candidatus Hydrogenedentes bacterium]|nr:methyltransferase domain-containing protein [Candidatus Hydrogenedentota bacterium]